jgi:hypothetical protein
MIFVVTNLVVGLIYLLPISGQLSGEIVTYPGPSGIAPSDQYSVKLQQDGWDYDSFVYITRAQWKTNQSKTTSWTSFSFSGAVDVSVTKLKGSFESCRVLPTGYRIKPNIDGNTAKFAINRPCHIAVEFDEDITHPMLIFANPIETDKPDREDSNTIYFAPGVHNVGDRFTIGEGKTVYLAGGAYVKGKFFSQDASNIVIRGRGILSGEEFEKGGSHLIEINGWKTRNTLIEGITLINSPHYNISMDGFHNTVGNVKMISWYFSTDGVNTGRDGLVEKCFFKVNDDALKLYFSNMVVRDCVIWQLENGAPFQISWNMPSDNSGFHVSNIHVIRAEHRWDNDNLAIFDAIHGGRGHMRDYLFENIQIENADWRLFFITIQPNEFADPAGGFGQISHLIFRNITVDGSMKKQNTIRGQGAEHQVYNVTFENIKVNGKYITNAEDGNFEIDPESTKNIRFLVGEN